MNYYYKSTSKALNERAGRQIKRKESLPSVMVIEDSEIYCTWLSQCTLIDTFQVGFCKIFCSTAKSNCSREHFFLKLLYHKIIKLILALLVLHTRLNHHNNLFCLSEALYCNVEGPGFLVGFILMETTVRSLFPSLFVLIDS